MRIRIVLGVFLTLLFSLIAGAVELNTNDQGIALHGYDPVAYVMEQEPTMGDASFSASHAGATYHFASQGNLEMFLQSPEKFAPQYGGYCSYGVRVGKKFDVDPGAFSVVDNRLYMLLNKGTHAIWLQERDKNIEIADRLWPSIRGVPANQLTDDE